MSGEIYEVIERLVHDTSGNFSMGDFTDKPCPAITIGVNAINACHYQVYYRMTDRPPSNLPALDPSKPPYRVPSMGEIRALPWNGRRVVSTFAGCGGSSTGYRMAGFKVAWASEFVDAARESYLANCDPSTVVDGRDVREVRPEDVLAAAGLREGELDVLDGSPPCAAFSTSGKREKGWGQVKAYSDKKQRVDDLFFEYARLLRGIRPKAFVAENVSGLVKGTAKGYFLEILAALKGCGYRVSAKVLDAQWLGVPQSRQRLIFVGVREDLGVDPEHPRPLPYNYSVREAIPWIRRIDLGAHGHFDGRVDDATVESSPTVLANSMGSFNYAVEVEPEADISKYAIGAEWDRLAPGEGSDKYINLVRAPLDAPCPTVTTMGQSGAASVSHPTEKRKFSIAELKRICGFPDDFVLTGTYAQRWERLGRAVPPVMMAHVARTVLVTLDRAEGKS